MVLLNIQVQQGITGHWFWKLLSAKNGKLVATSREYSTKQMCIKTAANLYEDVRINRLDLVELDKTCSSGDDGDGDANCNIVRTLFAPQYSVRLSPL